MALSKRALAALAGFLMALTGVLGTASAAQATENDAGSAPGAGVTSMSDDGRSLRSALAAQSADDAGALANPGVSPAPENTFYDRTYSQAIDLVNTCPSGRFCTYQQQDNGLYRAYDFYACANYSLSNWFDARWSYNNQTGGVTVRLLGSGGQQEDTVGPGQKKAVYWDPIWTIDLC
ncbi:hypothetical protein [Myceligenerans salitolerans]|uniref:Peptidase inhibitor family I36 n=1 Tax=Myceligenerans salitolerans TaxID=1230528 RepID=A0ABS3I621_9MICO|nr:hypothetical protein [Myceligenerans salitolerans]MBO0607829.1 hypothetical protein [Myceligenerans salitolerans]